MTKRKINYPILIALFSIIVAGCGRAAQQPHKATQTLSNQMIKPGEKIGDFLITTGEGEDVIFVSILHCP
jgi:hypothetical protein